MPSIASPSDAVDGLPRHRVADRACNASVGDSRQRLRTQSASTGAVWQKCAAVVCAAVVALRPLVAAGRDTHNTRYQPLPLVLHSQQLQNVHGNTYLQLQVPITLLRHPSPAAAAARLRARGLLASLPAPLASTAPPPLLLLNPAGRDQRHCRAAQDSELRSGRLTRIGVVPTRTGEFGAAVPFTGRVSRPGTVPLITPAALGAAKRGLELTVAYQSRRVACVERPYPV